MHGENKQAHYLFYLHGQIVEGSDGSPVSPIYGIYQYHEIVKTFSDLGFRVISEIRPHNCAIAPYAQKIANEITDLLNKDILPTQITVVGASRGGMIAAMVSHAMADQPLLRYVILAGLFQPFYKKENLPLHGQVLSIHDKADKYPITPELFFENSKALTRHQIIVTDTGLGHGLIFRPYPIWVEEVLAWTIPEYGTLEETLAKQRGSRY